MGDFQFDFVLIRVVRVLISENEYCLSKENFFLLFFKLKKVLINLSKLFYDKFSASSFKLILAFTIFLLQIMY